MLEKKGIGEENPARFSFTNKYIKLYTDDTTVFITVWTKNGSSLYDSFSINAKLKQETDELVLGRYQQRRSSIEKIGNITLKQKKELEKLPLEEQLKIRMKYKQIVSMSLLGIINPPDILSLPNDIKPYAYILDNQCLGELFHALIN